MDTQVVAPHRNYPIYVDRVREIQEFLRTIAIEPFGSYWQFLKDGKVFATICPCTSTSLSTPTAFIFDKDSQTFELINVMLSDPFNKMAQFKSTHHSQRSQRLNLLQYLLPLVSEHIHVIVSGLRGCRFKEQFFSDTQKLSGYTFGIGDELLGGIYVRREIDGTPVTFHSTEYWISHPKRFQWYHDLKAELARPNDNGVDMTDPANNLYWQVMISLLPHIDTARRKLLESMGETQH